ncbi:ricin-type beta-trefoil lectin domain protein [Rubrivirga marina]|uniref:Ricin B lectin domain-containing protein n=1 Tax=Rubrivirga marina TaxID=1196024 RepID=A0A271J4U6_9BACT|nr:ricin-type beta-trefoil lectin domain protein [Rubrivirga marina]PAP77975.1 hypothetical protein BSZ37_16780 [Rubrivirga marina]
MRLLLLLALAAAGPASAQPGAFLTASPQACLSAPDGPVVTTDCTAASNQFEVDRVGPHTVVRVGTQCLAGATSGAPVRAVPCRGGDPAQGWRITDGRVESAAAPGLCLALGAPPAQGARATLEACATDGPAAERQWFALGEIVQNAALARLARRADTLVGSEHVRRHPSGVAVIADGSNHFVRTGGATYARAPRGAIR